MWSEHKLTKIERTKIMDFKLLIRRFLAFIIDWNLIFAPGMALMYFGPGSNPDYFYYPSIYMFKSLGFILGLLWMPLYCLFKDCLCGRRSLGKLICGLAIENAETGEKAAYGSLIVRNLAYVIITIEGIVVLLNNGRRIGDLMANTRVVRYKKVK